MKNIPKKIHQIWLGGELPEVFLKYQKTWIEKNPGWSLIIWDEKKIKKLKNIKLKDYYLCKNYSEKSDYLRFCILLEHGGIYVDTDFECYKGFGDMIKKGCFVIGEEFYGIYNAAFMAAPPGNKTVNKIFFKFHAQLQKPPRGCRTGPIFISKYINNTSKKIQIIPGRYLYPEYWLYTNTNLAECYANHHYASSWQGSFNKKIFFIKQKLSQQIIGKFIVIVVHYLILQIRKSTI